MSKERDLSQMLAKFPYMLLLIFIFISAGTILIYHSLIGMTVIVLFMWLTVSLLIFSRKFEIIFLTSIFLYPLFPPYVGIEFGPTIPIINAQRILIYTIVIAWLGKKLLGYGDRSLPTARARQLKLDIGVLTVIVGFKLLSGILTGWYSFLTSINESIYFFLLYYIALDTFVNVSQRYRVYKALSGAVILLSIFAIYEYMTGANPLNAIEPIRQGHMVSAQHLITRIGHPRAEATLGHPIALGMFLILGIPSLFGWMKLQDSLKIKLFMWGGIGISFAALLTTGSRGPLLGLLAAILIFLVRTPKKLLLVGLFVALFLLQPFIMQNLTTRTIEILKAVFTANLLNPNPESTYWKSQSRATVESRVLQAIIGGRKVLQSPLIGYGFGEKESVISLRSIDNYYLLSALESGIIQCAALMILIFWVSWSITRLTRRKTGQSGITELQVLAISSMGYALALFTVSLKATIPLFFIILALARNATRRYQS